MGKKYRVYWSGTWNTPSTSTHMKENSKMKNSMAMEPWRTTMAHTVECLSKDRNTGRGTSKPIEGRVTRELSHLEFWCKPMQQIQHLRKTKINMPEKRSYEKQKSINDSLFYFWKFPYYITCGELDVFDQLQLINNNDHTIQELAEGTHPHTIPISLQIWRRSSRNWPNPNATSKWQPWWLNLLFRLLSRSELNCQKDDQDYCAIWESKRPRKCDSEHPVARDGPEWVGYCVVVGRYWGGV